MNFVIKSRRYFDKEKKKPEARKIINTIVFEGMILPSRKQSIIEYFQKKYADHKVVFIPGVQLEPAQSITPLQHLSQLCTITAQWISTQVQPYVEDNYLVLLDQYYHRYEAMALLFEVQQAQARMKLDVEEMKKRGEKIPAKLPLDVSMTTINELRKITASIPRPDILFSLFDSSEPQAAMGRRAFNDLFSTESYIFPINLFYEDDTVVREMEARLSNFKIGGDKNNG